MHAVCGWTHQCHRRLLDKVRDIQSLRIFGLICFANHSIEILEQKQLKNCGPQVLEMLIKMFGNKITPQWWSLRQSVSGFKPKVPGVWCLKAFRVENLKLPVVAHTCSPGTRSWGGRFLRDEVWPSYKVSSRPGGLRTWVNWNKGATSTNSPLYEVYSLFSLFQWVGFFPPLK